MNTKKIMLAMSLILSGMNIFSAQDDHNYGSGYYDNIKKLATTGSCKGCNFAHYNKNYVIPINYLAKDFNDALAAARKLNKPINLSETNLYGLNLSNLDLSNTDLRGAYLGYTNVTNTNFTNAKVDEDVKTVISNHHGHNIYYDGTRFDKSNITSAQRASFAK